LVGHAICASCHGRLPNKLRCHACSVAGGYHRCIALEKVLEAVRVPCSNAVHGCAVTTRYHERAGHERSCPHRQVSCEEDGCDFAGSTYALLGMEHVLEHVLADHVVAALTL
jgi:E3 ubiquitin-protein ligase SIAH1